MIKTRNAILFSTFILISIGMLMIYTSSYAWAVYKFNNGFHFVIYQLMFLLVGIVIFYFVSKLNLDIIKNNINKIILLNFVLLLLVLVPGIGVVRNGSRSWFSLGPFGFQPSELMKISLIIFTAKYLEKNHYRINKIKDRLLPLLLIVFTSIFLIMLEPDFGTSMVIILTILSMIFASGLKYKFFSMSFLIGLFLISIIILIAPYRMARIISFLNPWVDPLGSGYQIIQSLYAIGPGGLFGQGLFNSRQKYFYLPEPQTDFIFSIACEELGFIFALFIIITFIVLIVSMYYVSTCTQDKFKKFLCMGIFALFSIQTIMNLSVVVGLIPVTGVTLPFLSYGGSSLITSLVSVGLVYNIANKKN